MPISEKIVHTVSEYIDTITPLKDRHSRLWFRGHSTEEYSLQPTVYREPYSWAAEEGLLHQFKARAARFISNPPSSDIEWLFIMQHHATPTRLLDWSENALVALAFAAQYRKSYHNGKNANVWCLDPIKLNSNIRFPLFEMEPIPNICESDDLRMMFENPRQNYPVAIIGPQNTDRIIAQRGVFTLFPNKESFSMDNIENAGEFLYRIVIPDECISSICDDLYYLGMTESTLFPELDSISKELKKDYESRC